MANNSGIKINPKHKGAFTKKAKAAGMSVQKFAQHVHAHPDKYSGSTRKQANFAKNAKKFKHQTGGPGLADLGQSGPQSVAGNFPSIDPNYDPMDQMGPHAESQMNSALIDENNQGSFINTQAGQKMQTRYASKNAPYIKDFNQAATAATNIGNAISDKKLKRQEYFQTVKSMTPKFMTNTNQGGLNNTPAYTMFGGDDRSFATMEMGGGIDYMMVGGNAPGQYDYSNKTNEEYGHEGIAHNAFYGDNSIYAAGGDVTSSKAKEILRDGTVHGHALTDRQKRYFGWIAGGKKMMGGYQTGGPVQTAAPAPTQQSAPGGHTEDYYQNSATLAYYKGVLNDKLKAKNPQAYTDYLSGLQQARKAGDPKQVNQYTEASKYDQYLSPDEIKKALGSDKDYDRYLNSVKYLNSAQGGNALSGVVEGNQDLNSLNYGRRFMGIPLTTSYNPQINEGANARRYKRDYNYNPVTGKVDITEQGDLSQRPQGLSAAQAEQQQAQQTQQTASRQYGGPRDIRNERESFSYYRGAQTGGYAVGDEIELSAAEIAHLKKQGYKIKMVK